MPNGDFMLRKEDLKYKDEYCTEFVIKQIETVKKYFGIISLSP